MSKVSSKLQLTLPKALAEEHGIHPGDEVQWVSAGDAIWLIPPGKAPPSRDTQTRLELFDQATRRQREREGKRPRRLLRKPNKASSRGWTREELYEPGRPR